MTAHYSAPGAQRLSSRTAFDYATGRLWDVDAIETCAVVYPGDGMQPTTVVRPGRVFLILIVAWS